MARKQARRRKQPKVRKFKMPTIRLRPLFTPVIALLLIVGTYELSARLLDREIGALELSGPFSASQRCKLKRLSAQSWKLGSLGQISAISATWCVSFPGSTKRQLHVAGQIVLRSRLANRCRPQSGVTVAC